MAKYLLHIFLKEMDAVYQILDFDAILQIADETQDLPNCF